MEVRPKCCCLMEGWLLTLPWPSGLLSVSLSLSLSLSFAHSISSILSYLVHRRQLSTTIHSYLIFIKRMSPHYGICRFQGWEGSSRVFFFFFFFFFLILLSSSSFAPACGASFYFPLDNAEKNFTLRNLVGLLVALFLSFAHSVNVIVLDVYEPTLRALKTKKPHIVFHIIVIRLSSCLCLDNYRICVSYLCYRV